ENMAGDRLGIVGGRLIRVSLRKLRVSSVPRVFFETVLGGGKGGGLCFWHRRLPVGCLRGSSKHSSATPTGDRGRVGSLPSRGIKLVRSRIMKEIAELMPVRRCGCCEVSTGEESMSVMAMFRQSFQV